MRTTLDLDPAVLEAAKAVARYQRTSVGKIISAWARQGLGTQAAPARRKGFPVFEVPKGATVISPSRASELISDEGLPARR